MSDKEYSCPACNVPDSAGLNQCGRQDCGHKDRQTNNTPAPQAASEDKVLNNLAWDLVADLACPNDAAGREMLGKRAASLIDQRDALPSSDSVTISRDCAEYAVLCMKKEDAIALAMINELEIPIEYVKRKYTLTQEIEQALKP
jgi:hypothetical protein